MPDAMRIDITLSGINPDLPARSSPGKLTHYPDIIHRTVWVLATDRTGRARPWSVALSSQDSADTRSGPTFYCMSPV
jgi:hypothetical protein